MRRLSRALVWLWASLVTAAVHAQAPQAPQAPQAHAADCKSDDHLSAAAAELLLHAQTHPDAPQLTAAVRSADSDAVGLHALFLAPSNEHAAQGWLTQQRQRADAELICGEAQSELGRMLIVSAKGGSLAGIHARKPVVSGELRPGFDRAELVIASADGGLARIGVSAANLTQGITLERERPLPWNVQLVAHGPAGPRPVAERWVTAADAHDAAPEVVVEAQTDPTNPGDLAKLIIDLRELRRRPRLRDNRLLRQAATQHATAVCEQGRVAHELIQGTGPRERLTRVGLQARLVGEAIARAADPAAAFQALQRSPSHLLTLLEPRFTDYGVGIARDSTGKQCFVVLLCAWPRVL